MATPVSPQFKKALVAPIRDVRMQVFALEATAEASYYHLNKPGLLFAYTSSSTDLSGKTAVANSGVTFDWPTAFAPASGTGMDFSGSAYFTISNAYDIQIANEFSIAFWVRRDNQNAHTIAHWGTNSVSIGFTAAGNLVVTKVGGSAAWTSENVYTDLLPHHYVITKLANQLSVYVDGVRANGTDSGQTFVAATANLYVGATSTPGVYLDGQMDELIVTNAGTTAYDANAWYNTYLYNGNYKVIQEVTDVIEGTVYVDTDRAMRRTSQIKVANPGGIYSPETPDALFWWDKLFTIQYGVKVNGEYEYVPLGYFMVDVNEVMAEKGSSILNIDGSDLWKRFAKSDFALPVAYFMNTTYNDVIKSFANQAGIFRMNLDSLSDRATTEKTLQAPLYYEIDDNRGDKLWDLCEKWGLDIYFDVAGVLTTRDKTKRINNLNQTTPIWSFKGGAEAIFLSITKRRSGDSIDNHIVVSGELDDGGIVVIAEAIDGFGTDATGPGWSRKYTNNPFSPTRVERIGDRVKRIKSDTIRTSAAAQIVADAELQKGSSVEEDIRLPTIVVPHLEGFDVIEIVEPTLSKTNDKYFLKRFDIPMRSGSQQEINVTKLRGIL